jgi:hypothetical protein
VAVVTAGDHEAGRQALQVPFPGRWKRLVEVVDVEHDAPLGRCERTEVHQMAIAAGLHGQVRGGQPRKIGRHDRGRAPVEGERRDHHAAVADRDQLLDAACA